MSLQENAVLVRLNISQLNNHRSDPDLTEETRERHALGKGAGNWVKTKLPDDALAPIRKVAGQAREAHYKLSLPWEDNNRLLPIVKRGEYERVMGDAKTSFDEAINEFIRDYDRWVDKARDIHNGTFDPDDYPPKYDLHDQFSFKTEYSPIPADDRFAWLKRDVEKANERRLHEAMNDMWLRVLDPLLLMAEKLAQPNPIFRDSLVENLRAVTAQVPEYNLIHDAALGDCARQVNELLAEVSADALRQNANTRIETAGKAVAILQQFKLGERKFAK